MKKIFLSPFWRAAFFLSGMMMGVGMYGIPYVFSRAGFLLGTLELLVLTGVVLLIHLMYGEIVLRTRQWHRLPGYAAIYVGPWAKRLEILSYTVSFSGALGAYVLLGGEFLSNITSTGGAHAWSYAVLAAGACFLFFGLRYHARIDTITVSMLILLIGGLFVVALPHIQTAHFAPLHIHQWFLPYGVIMFALAGMAAVPDMVGALEHNPQKLRRAIMAGTLIPAALYFLFAFSVVGVSGDQTSEEAIRGFAAVAGPWALGLGSIIGALSTFGAFIALGSVFKAMLHLDIGFGWKTSWFLVVLMPFLFIFLGFQSYLPIIGFLGAVSIAFDGLMTLLVYQRAHARGDRRAEYELHIPPFLLILLGLVFVGGVLYEVLF